MIIYSPCRYIWWILNYPVNIRPYRDNKLLYGPQHETGCKLFIYLFWVLLKQNSRKITLSGEKRGSDIKDDNARPH